MRRISAPVRVSGRTYRVKATRHHDCAMERLHSPSYGGVPGMISGASGIGCERGGAQFRLRVLRVVWAR